MPATEPLKICVFCGSHPGHDPAYLACATQLGREIAEAGWTLVYGGGARGLMGALADAASAAGGRIIGVRPASLSHIEMPRLEGVELEHVSDLFERKRRMIEISDAFITLPGGIGTLDEMLEVITTAQLRLHDKPSVLVNLNGLFDPFLHGIARLQDEGFIYRAPGEYLTQAATPREAIAQIAVRLNAGPRRSAAAG